MRSMMVRASKQKSPAESTMDMVKIRDIIVNNKKLSVMPAETPMQVRDLEEVLSNGTIPPGSQSRPSLTGYSKYRGKAHHLMLSGRADKTSDPGTEVQPSATRESSPKMRRHIDLPVPPAFSDSPQEVKGFKK